MSLNTHQAIGYHINQLMLNFNNQTPIRDMINAIEDYNDNQHVVWAKPIGTDYEVAYELNNLSTYKNRVKGHKSFKITVNSKTNPKTKSTIEYASNSNVPLPIIYITGETDPFALLNWHKFYTANLTAVINGLKVVASDAVKTRFTVETVG